MARRSRSTRRCTACSLNLGDETPRGFETFARMFEVVSADEADRLAARERWKAMRDRGYEIKKHEAEAANEHRPAAAVERFRR